MARPSLLTTADVGFVWEHAMAHRNALGVMSPLTRFSAVPYFIDPFTARRPADQWHFDHQQAHDDSQNHLPADYLGDIVVGTGVGANLVDSDLSDPWNRSWWTFKNHIEHFVGSNTILPQPQTPPPPPAPVWKFPFW
jgi:hypothetical protein